MEVKQKIVETIIDCMPSHAKKYLSENELSGVTLSVHWKLDNDPDRPNKYSKTIAIHMPQEFFEDFPGYPPEMQRAALSSIVSYISGKLKDFDPDHKVPKYSQPPVEEWELPLENIFG
jgi:hypothetical protein